jgi:hypothetical protein
MNAVRHWGVLRGSVFRGFGGFASLSRLGFGGILALFGGSDFERAARASEFAPLTVRITPAGAVRIEHASDPGSYFVLEAGASVRTITQPSRLSLGFAGTGGFEEPVAAVLARFFRLRQVPLTAPLDLDGDGIDDVYELRHPRALDPLNAADAGGDFDGDGKSNLSEYRDGTDPEDGGGMGATVYVVDDPPAGSVVHFRTLTNAWAVLAATMPAGRAGRIVVATATPQDIETLDLTGGVDLEVGEGFAGRVVLRGPGTGPLTVRAAGGFGLSGFTIENAGGLRVSAGRRLALRGNRLPGTTVVVGQAAGLHASPAVHGDGASSVAVGDCVFAGPLHLQWFGSAGTDATLGLTGNSASVIDASVRGSFGGQATVRGNIAENVTLSFDALASAQVVLSQMANLEELNLIGEATGNPSVTVSEVLAGAVNLNFGGLGSVFLTVGGLSSKTLTVQAGAAESDIQVSDSTADDIVLDVRQPSGAPPKVRQRIRNASVKAGISLNAWDAEHGQIDLSLAAVNASTLEVRTRAFTRLDLSDRVTLTGQFRATVEAEVLELNSVQARLEAGLEVKAAGVGAGVTAFWQGGTVRGKADFECASGVWAGLTIDSTVFDPGGAFSVYEGGGRSLQGARGPETPGAGPARRLHGQAGRTILLRNLSEAPGLVLIADVESAVTLQTCAFHSTGFTPAVVLEEVGGDILIEDCRFQGQGLGVSNAKRDVVVSGNDFQVSSVGPPAIGISAASATVVDNRVGGSGLSGLGLDVTGQATVRDLQLSGEFGVTIGSGEVAWEDGRIGGMATITGGRVRARGVAFGPVIMVGGTGLLGLEDCGLAGVMVADFNEHGGLLNDPTGSGARPEDVYSSIDFDADSRHCADYPPPQVREDTGDCVRPGVPVPR